MQNRLMAIKRILSLLPAATEIVCALGLEDQLVGRSHECDFPESVQDLPACTSSSVNNAATSAEIDARVKGALLNALSVYQVDTQLVQGLKPDLVITQSQCEACALSLDDVEKALVNLLDKAAEMVSLSPNRLSDIFSDIRQIASVLDHESRGEALIEELSDRVELIRHKLKFVENRPKVACIEWLSPLMTAGNWTPELIEIAGGIPLLSETGQHSSYIDGTGLLEANPDIIVIASCGFSIERSLQEIHLLMGLKGWEDLNAVKNNQLYIADGNHYFNRPGPRIVDSLEILAEIIHPRQFIFGYEGSGWIRFNLS